jgi:hypothetical protein
MINQSSIKYISQLLSRPETISEGDQSSVALFRQTFPYFVPARYIQAAEQHKKVAFTPKMLSEIQPYMGNWLLLCNFLEAGRNGSSRHDVRDIKPVQKPEINIQQVQEKPIIKVEPAKPIAAEVRTEPPVVVPEVKAEPVKPIVAEVKAAPPVVAEVKVEPVKPVVPEVKIVPPAVPGAAEIKTLPKVNIVPPVVAEAKIPPSTSVAAEMKTVSKVDPVPPVVAEVKIPPVPLAAELKVETNAASAPVASEVKMPATTQPVAEIKAAPKVEPVPQIVTEVKAATPAPPVVPVAKTVDEYNAIRLEAVQMKITSPVLPEVKTEPKTEAMKPLAEVKAHSVVPLAVVPVVEKAKETIILPGKEQQAILAGFIPAKVIIKKQIEVPDEKEPVHAKQTEETPIALPSKIDLVEFVEDAINDREKDDLIFPVYTEDYFLQQGVKVSAEIPGTIDEFKEAVETDDEEKALMVMMSFTEWLLHFKSTAEKQKGEKKDQKALKTMWQKEKLAAAMEEENEEIPENVFEMAVNSITKEDGLASESLADIYIKQGRYDQAIEMYRKLSLRNPKKNAYFARRIEEVLKEKQS